MALLERIAAALGFARIRPRRRDFPAAQITRLTSSWTTDPGAVNKWLRHDLRTLRARSRQLCRADGYAKKFLHSAVNNIAGDRPFMLQSKVRRPRGAMDTEVNKKLEAAWRRWSRMGRCDVTGKLMLAEIHRMMIRALARDGEALLRLRIERGTGLQLQVLDVDRLDEEKNDVLGNGNSIKLGVEVNGFGRPVAYHVLRTVPGEIGYWGQSGIKEYERIPAEQIIHLFIPEYPEQVRGMPWMHAALLRLYNLSGFEEAAVIAARVGASKMGFYTSPDGGTVGTVGDAKDARGNLIQDAEPGHFDALPEGYKLESWDPAFPDTAVEPFMRSTLRGIAASVGCAYHSLANDPSNVNYSTARVALLEERDMWSAIQQWYTEALCVPVFEAWRDVEVAAGRLPIEWVQQERFDAIQWQCKTWDWVDPMKDIQAEILALDKGLTSRGRIAAKAGEDIEDILDELAAEQAMLEEKNLSFGPQPAQPATEPADPEEKDPEDERTIRAVA